jgi:hypothetical protein
VDCAQEEDESHTPPLTLWAFLSQLLYEGEKQKIPLSGFLSRKICAKLGTDQPPFAMITANEQKPANRNRQNTDAGFVPLRHLEKLHRLHASDLHVTC